MGGGTQAMKGHISDLRKMRKLERLSLIKERYRKLILEPRRQLEMQLDSDDYAEDDLEVEREYSEVEEVLVDYYTADDEVE